ncbi:MAG: cysteine hydrolase family protein [Pseudomonas sp.]|uniref:cysteine hydrolase family protein n=1 Tax=Pseudomonas sp. TaxID=306 RepID=UPI0033972792
MNRLARNAVLMVIDVQQAFDHPRWGARNNPAAEERIAALLQGWRDSGRPVVHVQHRSAHADSLFHPDQPGFQFKPQALPWPGEPLLHKAVNSAFIGTDLEQRLRALKADSLVIVGLTTDHCVSTTTRMAANLGFETWLVSDATATFERRGPDDQLFSAEQMHATALASLHQEFAQVCGSAELLERL